MSELCSSCRESFNLLRWRHKCQYCTNEFCTDCLIKESLTWISYSHNFHIVFDTKAKEISYRHANRIDKNFYNLCGNCISLLRKSIDDYKNEIDNKMQTIMLTSENQIPDFKVVRSFGLITYKESLSAGMHNMKNKNLTVNKLMYISKAKEYLKIEALILGANALINYTDTQRLKSVPVLSPNSFRTQPQIPKKIVYRTPFDFTPMGRRKLYNQTININTPNRKPEYRLVTNYVIQAEAVLIKKTRDNK